ncbi:universal stress protein [Flavobacteriaceae bacterium]|jgi:nucleotide-binding universal stress UspA family protein|nr:universal stress protein [Flavobacteriaceae bacterium]MDA9879317.1 universal stress protein [Flavobacteriaceae bacterium]
MQNILLPLGTSIHAESTLAYTLALASHFKSTVYVIDAYPAHSTMSTLANVGARLEEENIKQIKALVSKVAPGSKKIKIVSSERDLIGTIKSLNAKIGLDLIVTAPLNNEINEEVFLGRIAGSVIKRTKIPVLVAPLDKEFNPPKRMLLAFKTGEVKASSTLDPLIKIQDQFESKLKLLLVKVPGFANRNHQLNDELLQRSNKLIYSENATVYQGVLEHFQANQPDFLVAFKRERGFFEKLWEPDLIYKKDFYCTVPLLVLKNKD